MRNIFFFINIIKKIIYIYIYIYIYMKNMYFSHTKGHVSLY
jgi:hypothetical protein